MSQTQFAKKKSSPCCIGCIVLLIIGIIACGGLVFWMYRFAKNNISLVHVTSKADPAIDTDPEILLPKKVGDFERASVSDNLKDVPEMAETKTTGVAVAQYKDDQDHQITVIALPTAEAKNQRQNRMGPFTWGRGKANSSDTGISIKEPYSGKSPRTIVTWSKTNWTFMVQTSSTLASKFVENFNPGSEADQQTTGSTTSESSVTTVTAQ